ncbi:MAG: M1 family metallopeptidase [Candidatus Micrarchaeota archaeon]|nr:M1 family metallopeptidase [Candidatus Micrarchaeota archaeon]
MVRDSLGKDVVPLRYSLTFEPDFKSFKFSGKAVVSVAAGKRCSEITMNAAELEIGSAVVTSGSARQKAKVSHDRKRQRVTFSVAKPFKGDAEIEIEFRGLHNDKMYGFYRSRYSENGKERYMLSSQFEAANARNAFPCFDEPELKAVFDVCMIVDKDKECLSNMPVKEARIMRDGRKLVRFHETPKMATYLLYLGVGSYDSVEGISNGVKLRLFATPGKRKMLELPLDYSKRIFGFFVDYFGVRYPLPKLDLIAIPDFAAGAMENWGAMTFRESALLADKDSSTATKQRVAEVIAHEMAHQWFGDLVTMEWWDDLWLNESFATFMSYKAMDKVFPEWHVSLEYLDDFIAPAMGADQLLHTNPISVEVNSPSDIERVFALSAIVYEKGGSILRMVENYSGSETFRMGLRSYLKKHSYSNATKHDLWSAIDGAAKGSRTKVAEVASAWIDKKGFPVVEVSVRNGEALLKQRRFTLLSNSDRQTWPIPISYVDSDGMKERKALMEGKELRLKLEGEWLKLNYGQYGFYRTAYPMAMLNSLGEMVSGKGLSSSDAWGIESDLFAFMVSGRVGIEEYTGFVDRYCFNAEYPLNSRVLGHLHWLVSRLYGNSRILKEVEELARSYSGELLDRLGWEWKDGERTSDTMTRNSAISLSGIAGNASTVGKATGMFNDFMKGKISLNNNLRGAIYGIAAWNGNRELYADLKKRYVKEEVIEEKNRLLRTLGYFKDHSILKDALDFSLSKDVRYQDAFVVHSIVCGNPVGRDIVWKWTRENWKELMKRFPSGTHMLDRYAENMGVLSTNGDKESIRLFFSEPKNMRDDIGQSVDRALESIEINTRFMQRL